MTVIVFEAPAALRALPPNRATRRYVPAGARQVMAALPFDSVTAFRRERFPCAPTRAKEMTPALAGEVDALRRSAPLAVTIAVNATCGETRMSADLLTVRYWSVPAQTAVIVALWRRGGTTAVYWNWLVSDSSSEPSDLSGTVATSVSVVCPACRS